MVEDLAASLAFYRRLGLDVPSHVDGPHVEVTLPGGLILAWDTVETIRSFDPHRAASPAGTGWVWPSVAPIRTRSTARTRTWFRLGRVGDHELRVGYLSLVTISNAGGDVTVEPSTTVVDRPVRVDGQLFTKSRVVTHDSRGWADRA